MIARHSGPLPYVFSVFCYSDSKNSSNNSNNNKNNDRSNNITTITNTSGTDGGTDVSGFTPDIIGSDTRQDTPVILVWDNLYDGRGIVITYVTGVIKCIWDLAIKRCDNTRACDKKGV